MNESQPRPPGKSSTNWRSAHRSRQHDAAHADDAADHSDHPTDNPLIPHQAAKLIIDQDELHSLLSRLRAAGSFAYDTEFIGELTYHPRLCVIQVATKSEIALIDCFAELDLKPFWELLADAAIEKVVHAGEQDMEPVVRHLGRKAENVIDMQIAAGFVGMAYPVALSKLVREVVGVKLSKGLTFTNWDQRPLSKMQLKYAADDVRYLPVLRAELGKRLDARGHTTLAFEESAAMCEPSRFLFDRESDYLRMRGAGSLTTTGLLVLRELMALRDELAQHEDVPPRSLLRDEVLIDLSRAPVKDVAKLENVRGLPRPVRERYASRILESTQRGLSQPRENAPRIDSFEPSPTERFASEALYASACVLCSSQGVDTALVASRQDISELYNRLRSGSDVADMRVMSGWRKRLVGDSLTQLFSDKARLLLTKRVE